MRFILTILFLFLTIDAFARHEDFDFVKTIKDSKYSVVAKVIKVEMMSQDTGFGTEVCGFSTYIEVISDLKANAPQFLSVGIKYPVLANHSYFMIIENGKAKFPTDQVLTYTDKKTIQSIEKCKFSLPEYSVNQLVMGEIKSGEIFEWLEKPLYLSIPANVDTREFIIEKSKAIETMEGVGKEISIGWKLPPKGFKYGATFLNWDQLMEVWRRRP